MKIIKKIKRLSADYRKHEKEIAEIELKKTIEFVNLAISLSTTAVQLTAIAAQGKSLSNAEGGIVPPVNKDKVN